MVENKSLHECQAPSPPLPGECASGAYFWPYLLSKNLGRTLFEDFKNLVLALETSCCLSGRKDHHSKKGQALACTTDKTKVASGYI